MFGSNDLRGQRTFLGMPPLAYFSGRNQYAPPHAISSPPFRRGSSYAGAEPMKGCGSPPGSPEKRFTWRTRRGGKPEEISPTLHKTKNLGFIINDLRNLTPHPGPFHEPRNVGLDSRRLTRSHPSPLVALPVEGRGNRDRPSSLFRRRPARHRSEVH